MGNLKLEERKKKRKAKKQKKTRGELFRKEVIKEEEENEKIKPIEMKKRKRDKGNSLDNGKGVQLTKDGAEYSPTENEGNIDNSEGKIEAADATEIRARKSKKSKKRRKDNNTSLESENLLKKKEVFQDDAYCISSGDEQCSKGMKKWLMEYRQSRPGLKVLQQRIDDFMNAHEEKLYQERKEREAEAAKDGWTVVVHHKGRKKTTDYESGIAVGSVAPPIAQSLGTAKKHKEVNLEFYRFQKRESQRDEILALQSKFEQDRKRIQQLRAARKFKPY